jgi:DNA-binding transcriptional regulator of glucitol operon
MTNLAVFFIAIAVAWVFQLYFTYDQAMKFNETLKPLREQGKTAIGLGGKRFLGGRAFVALAHKGDTVVDARSMTGFTIFARPKVMPALIGLSLTRLAGDGDIPGVPDKVRKAAQMAASTLVNSTKPDPSEVEESS